MIRITISPFRRRKSFCLVCVQLYMVSPDLPAQIAVEPFCINPFCQLLILFLDILAQQNGGLVQYSLKCIVHFQQKP